MMGNDGISVADALALRNSGSNGGDDMWGGNGAWWVIILILFGLGGWGRGGYGFGGGADGGNGNNGYNACCVPATAQGVTDAFNFNQLDNGVRGLERGICDGFYTTSANISALGTALQNCCCQTQQAIADLGYNMGQGFCGVDKSILQSDFHVQSGFNALGSQLASCCCDLGRGQENLKYEIAQMANSLLVAGDKNTDRIINYLTQTELDNIRNERDEYRTQLQFATQTSNIVNQLMPVAKPAYITCSPYASAFGIGANYGYGCNTGCGCNSCC